jgi:hypothetical protein
MLIDVRCGLWWLWAGMKFTRVFIAEPEPVEVWQNINIYLRMTEYP